MTTTTTTTTSLRRNRIGSKNADLYSWEPLPYEKIESNYATQEYIQDKIRKDILDIDAILEPPESQDIGLWQYEHVRQFTLELNQYAVLLKDVCNSQTCPQMKATDDWLFLCAAHAKQQTQDCCAIDYIVHMLDSTATLLNSDKHFPKRSIEISQESLKQLQSTVRRLYRLFAHAFFHHRELYDEIETNTLICKRFTQFATKYKLISNNQLIING
ncbi:hypothetical protein SAMD00019534_080930 [Acytostelium subglobosum LB1]|uniref:hypothetical protein n=1 Tax=Acytostelium subglobosum LB1 TaxID=1410327 RepID=UPI000644A8B2|nr:hypothetical protein SAMD00019534_080930 [Acytostelium subglobosum LB1]GAM24918.1 hypothetical protein SAMD00019534_080930 [Acytostelium subglobosum LB1]|eukprot:XP_012752007.1 hypothetical protein SAMD00019534_080930 [Acytostelium subglobosum LB1]